MVTINIKNRDLWLLSAMMVFIAGIGLVISFGDYNNDEADINGHTSDEIRLRDDQGNFITLQEYIDTAVAGGGSVNVAYEVSPLINRAITSGNLTSLPNATDTAYTITPSTNGNALIIAKGNFGTTCGSAGSFDRAILRVDGAEIDRAIHTVASNHCGSRSFTLIGDISVNAGQNYDLDVIIWRHNTGVESNAAFQASNLKYSVIYSS